MRKRPSHFLVPWLSLGVWAIPAVADQQQKSATDVAAS